MSEPSSPGESQRGAPKFFVGCDEDESEGLDGYGSMRTDMELYEDDLEADSVRIAHEHFFDCAFFKINVMQLHWNGH